MNKIRYLVIILLIICLSCSHTITKGIIKAKSHQPETLIFIPITIYCGKNCSNTVLVPMFLEESWTINVEGKAKKDFVTETFYIPKTEWDSIKIGDEFDCIRSNSTANICKTERAKYSKERN